MYRKLGFHIEKNLIPKEEILNIRQKMIYVFRIFTNDFKTEYNELIIELFKNDKNGFIGCANVCQNLIELFRLSVDERLMLVLNQLGLEFPCVNTKPLVSFSSQFTANNENYWKIPAHQDWPSTQGSINGVTCWMPLVDIIDELGPLEIIPYSHLDGFIEHENDGVPKLKNEFSSFISLPLEIGDALFFSNFTIHRSGHNTSDKIRWTTHFRFDDVKEKTFIERKFPRQNINQRKEGILYPGFPSKEQIVDVFKSEAHNH